MLDYLILLFIIQDLWVEFYKSLASLKYLLIRLFIMVTINGIGNGQRKEVAAVEQAPEKQFPVILAVAVEDANYIDRP